MLPSNLHERFHEREGYETLHHYFVQIQYFTNANSKKLFNSTSNVVTGIICRFYPIR